METIKFWRGPALPMPTPAAPNDLANVPAKANCFCIEIVSCSIKLNISLCTAATSTLPLAICWTKAGFLDMIFITWDWIWACSLEAVFIPDKVLKASAENLVNLSKIL